MSMLVALMLFLLLLPIALTGCSRMTTEERWRWEREVRAVQITRDKEAVDGCESLGGTSGVHSSDVQKQVARRHGNVALVTGRWLWWNLKLRYIVEAYQCPDERLEALKARARGEIQ